MSIFRLILKTCPYFATESGRHGVQKLRTLKHPHVLACLEAAEMEMEIVLATGGSSDVPSAAPQSVQRQPSSLTMCFVCVRGIAQRLNRDCHTIY